MRIADFTALIKELPIEYHSFDIKKDNWRNVHQQDIINEIIPGNMITLSRFNLLYNQRDMKRFIVKVLMWGYPTKGRGNNIKNLLRPDNFEKLVNKMNQLKESQKVIGVKELEETLKIQGLGLSTLTKFLYFLSLKVENYKALILDNRVIESLKKFDDDALRSLRKISYGTDIYGYIDYLASMENLSIDLDVEPEKIEMFLYLLGRNLRKPKGEDGD